MNILKRALIQGVILGTLSIVMIYLVVEYLPPFGGIIIPIVFIVAALATSAVGAVVLRRRPSRA